MKLSTPKIFLINLAALVVCLVVLFFFLDRFLDGFTHHGEKVKVPELRGLKIEEAMNLLSEQNLRFEILDSLYEEGKEPETVLESNPASGDFVKEQRIVYLTVNAKEVPRVKMPDLIDKDIKQARIILESLGLKVGKITEAPGLAEDAVLRQLYKGREIMPQTEISRGSVIDLVVEDGSQQSFDNEETSIPNLVDYTFEEAGYMLESRGLRLGTVQSKGLIRDSLSAIVISQSPEYDPEGRLRKGERVNITITQ